MEPNPRDPLMAEVDRGGRAYIRNLALAEVAVLRGQFNVAKVLRALAHAQRVQATAAARLLVHDLNPAEAFRTILAELENPSISGSAAMTISSDPLLRSWVEESIVVRARAQDLARRALARLKGHSDVTETDVAQTLWGCYGCGYVAEDTLPDACPVCSAPATEFAWFGPFYSSTPEHLGQLRPAEILAILVAVPDEVEAVIAGRDEAWLAHTTSREEWSIKEIVGHMLETDLLFARRMRTVLEDPGVPSIDTPVPPWKLHEGHGYEELPVPDLLGRLRQARAGSVNLVRGLRPEDWTRRATIGGSTTTVLDLGTWLANHDRGHLAQIRQLVGLVL